MAGFVGGGVEQVPDPAKRRYGATLDLRRDDNEHFHDFEHSITLRNFGSGPSEEPSVDILGMLSPCV
jgi:hypothetical protein